MTEAEEESFMAHYGDEIEGNAVAYVDELEGAVNALWAELDTRGVLMLRQEQPEVVALCRRLHERDLHR